MAKLFLRKFYNSIKRHIFGMKKVKEAHKTGLAEIYFLQFICGSWYL